MKELNRSVSLDREPTLAESAAIRDALAEALADLGADVTHLTGTGLQFHMPAPWRTGKANPLFAVTGGEVRVSAGAGARRRVRYSLSFLRLRVYSAVAIAAIAVATFQRARPTVLVALAVAWLVVFALPWIIASRRFRRLVVAAADSAMITGRP
jgi:hypothetical protein